MVGAAVSVTLALAYVSSCAAFSLTPEASFRSSSLGLRRSATIARPRLQLGRLHAQMQPEHEHEHKTSEQPKFGWAAHNAAWQNFVRTAQEGWDSGAQDRASSSLPSIFLVPVWVGVAAMGLFLPAPQLLESILVGMSHGAGASNAVDMHSVASAVTGVSAAYAGKHVEVQTLSKITGTQRGNHCRADFQNFCSRYSGHLFTGSGGSSGRARHDAAEQSAGLVSSIEV